MRDAAYCCSVTCASSSPLARTPDSRLRTNTMPTVSGGVEGARSSGAGLCTAGEHMRPDGTGGTRVACEFAFEDAGRMPAVLHS